MRPYKSNDSGLNITVKFDIGPAIKRSINRTTRYIGNLSSATPFSVAGAVWPEVRLILTIPDLI